MAFEWEAPGGERIVVTVNPAPHQSQCYVHLPFTDLVGRSWKLEDLMNSDTYDRDGHELQNRGLYLDAAPWQAHVFAFEPVP